MVSNLAAGKRVRRMRRGKGGKLMSEGMMMQVAAMVEVGNT